MRVATPTDLMVNALAADGLAASTMALPEAPLASDAWQPLMTLVKAQRISGFLLQAADIGRMAVTEDQFEDVAAAHLESMSVAVKLERALIETTGALEKAGIPSRVLKGPAIAHLVYSDPSLRSFHDIDLLVASGDFERSIEVLGSVGCRRLHRRLGQRFDEQFAKGATLATDDGCEVDLHRTFVAGRFGLGIQLTDLFRTSSPFTIGGRTLAALGPEERFLHACYQAAVGDPVPRLVSLRDIAEFLLRTPLDLDRVRGLCRDWGGQPVMARAVRQTWETFGLADLNALSVWAERYRPSRSEERAVRAYTSERSGGAIAFTSLSAIPGLRSKVAFIRAVALPERDYLGSLSTGRRRRSWIRRGARSALRLRRRSA